MSALEWPVWVAKRFMVFVGAVIFFAVFGVMMRIGLASRSNAVLEICVALGIAIGAATIFYWLSLELSGGATQPEWRTVR